MFGFILGAVAVTAGIIIGASLSDDSSSSYNSDDSRELNERLKRKEEADRKFREEMKKREELRQEELRRRDEELKKAKEEMKRIKKDIRRMQKEDKEEYEKIIEEKKKREKQLREESKQIEEERRKSEKESQEAKEKAREVKKNIKENEKHVKLKINKYIDEGNFTELDRILQELDATFVFLKEELVKDSVSYKEFRSTGLVITNIYEFVGDIFYEKKEYDKAINMYENVRNLVSNNEDLSQDFYYKYAKTLHAIGRYNDALQYLNKYESILEKNNTLHKRRIDINLLYFDIYLSIEEDDKIEHYINSLINEEKAFKSRLEIIDKLGEYIGYSFTESNVILYFSMIERYRSLDKLKEIVNNERYKGFKYLSFYKGIIDYKEGRYNEALNLFEEFKENEFSHIFILNCKRFIEDFDEKYDEKSIIEKLEKASEDRYLDERINFYESNNKLIYMDTTNVKHYQKLLFSLYAYKLKKIYSNQEFDLLIEEIKDIIEKVDYWNYLSSDFKVELIFYYHFYRENNNKEYENIIWELLSQFSTKVELESYKQEKIKQNQEIQDIYIVLEERFPKLESPFYYSSIVKNKINNEKYTMLVTYIENLGLNKVEIRQQSILQDKIIGEKHKGIANIFHYEIEDGETRIIYPYFKDNLKNILETEELSLSIKYLYIRQIIEIFKGLEEEDIVLRTLHPDKIMVDENNNLILREVYLERSFKSESSSSVNSSVDYKRNLYFTPYSHNVDDPRINYYLLGLLIYEIMEEEYLFEGVMDFSTIQNLHEEKSVNKQNVSLIKSRWIQNDEKEDLVKVEKINEKLLALPKPIIDILKRSLDADIEKRPKDLKELERVIDSLIKKDTQEDEQSNEEEGTNYNEKLTNMKNIINKKLENIKEDQDIELKYLYETRTYIYELEKEDTDIKLSKDYLRTILSLFGNYRGLYNDKISKVDFIETTEKILEDMGV